MIGAIGAEDSPHLLHARRLRNKQLGFADSTDPSKVASAVGPLDHAPPPPSGSEIPLPKKNVEPGMREMDNRLKKLERSQVRESVHCLSLHSRCHPADY